MTDYPKKLIEVALPLDDINRHSVKEKNPFLKNHPRSLHLWWARRPLTAARSILFSQLVNDPGGKRGYFPGMTKEKTRQEREKLFDIIRELVKWENLNNEDLLEKARSEIIKSWEATCEITGESPTPLPSVLDPFSGGYAIPLESQRLGLFPIGTDLNPVAVTIGKALIEIPPIFLNRQPTGPQLAGGTQKSLLGQLNGTEGLVEDIKRYGALLSKMAKEKIGHYYPNINLPKELGGGESPVMAWIWAKTVFCQNPACGAEVPLIRSFELSVKKGSKARIEPIIDDTSPPRVNFKVYMDEKPALKGNVSRGGVICLCCNTPMPLKDVRNIGKAQQIGRRLIAIVCKTKKGRVYLSPDINHEKIAKKASPEIYPNTSLPDKALGFRVQQYGVTTHKQLFTNRQLLVLGTLFGLLEEIHSEVLSNAKSAGLEEGSRLANEGTDALAYADAIVIYLSLSISQYTRYHCMTAVWNKKNQNIAHAFGRQAIPMTWDFPESNPFEGPLTIETAVQWVRSALKNTNPKIKGLAKQKNANTTDEEFGNVIISTDPPYYDNVGYADLSDFFYVWLRLGLKNILPDLYSTMTVPKAEELVAEPFRHLNKKKAELFFMKGMVGAIQNMAKISHPAYPVTIYYAFKQSESNSKGTASTGWESFLEAVISAEFIITGTWPINTEDSTRLRGQNSNALASSIVLVCRKRSKNALTVSRKQFLRELDETLPDALEEMIGGTEGTSPIAPVDLAQAAIGPGMAVFSKYEAVLEADGSPMSIHNGLIFINKTIDEYFSKAESDMDSDTRFCVNWFLQYGFATGLFGEADVLARAKGTTVDGAAQAGVVASRAGKVRLLRKDEYPENWDPSTDKRIPIWEACHHLCRALKTSETEAGSLLAKMPEKGEAIRQLAYRLYTQCERKGWAEDARIYNELITSWPAILEESRKIGHRGSQMGMFE
mgnify:CR=1 FL=1